MIRSFRDQATEDFYHNRLTHRAARFPANIRSTELRKLDVLNAGTGLWICKCRQATGWNHSKAT